MRSFDVRIRHECLLAAWEGIKIGQRKKLCKTGFPCLCLVEITLWSMGRFPVMSVPQKSRVLAAAAEASPHEKEMKEEEKAAENDEEPRHRGSHVVGVIPGGGVMPGAVVGFLSRPLENSAHDRADHHRADPIDGEPEMPSDEAS